MEYISIILVAAAVFAVCYFADKAYTKVFRSQSQHKSGLSVRMSKRYGSIGLVVAVLGIAAVFSGFNASEKLLLFGGGVLVVVGAGLVVYYMTYGVFYDADGFVFTTFGKPSATYTYKDIKAQQLYNNQGYTLIELYLTDGKTVQLQSTMNGVYPFLDYAFEAWCQQTGTDKASCAFYDPANSCWFPPLEG